MRSSTSSSERVPRGPWLRTFAVALLAALVALVAWEALLRARGYRPGISDDALLWAASRVGPARHPNAVAFVGDSRVQLSIALDVVAETLPPAVPAQLAIPRRIRCRFSKTSPPTRPSSASR